MILRRVSVAVSTLALTLSLGSTGSAQAATPAIRTMTEVSHIRLVGLDPAVAYTFDEVGNAVVRLSPDFAQRGTYKSVETGKAPLTVRDIVLKGVEYTNVGKGWQQRKLSKSTLAIYRQHANPAYILKVMKGMPRLKRVSSHHYRAVGSLDTLGPYLEWELLYPAKNLTDRKITTLAIDLRTDSSGRLTKIAYSAGSQVAKFTATDSFGRFNKPVKITAPR